MDFRKVGEGSRRSMWTEEKEFHSYVGINWNVGAGRFFWNNTAYFYGDDHKVAEIGWEYDLGFDITEWLDVRWSHHSQHWADVESQNGSRFPVTDSYGFRIKFLTKGEK